jgi:excisionase family DNA binding protein
MSEEIKDNELLTDKEVAQLLKVSWRTVQNLRLEKKIKSVKLTAKISRIRPEHVKEYIEKLKAA